mgnify:CR=1 FL=1
MQGLETYCKSNLLDSSVLIAAKRMLRVSGSEEVALSRDNLEWVAKCMNMGPVAQHIYKIIQNAFETYKKDYQAGKIGEEQKKYIYNQVVTYNKMMNEAAKIAKIMAKDQKQMFIKSNTLKQDDDELSL